MDRDASCSARQILQLDQQLTPMDNAQSRWVQRVKAKRTRVLLCKSLNSFGKQRPKVTRKPIHLGNPGSNPFDEVLQLSNVKRAGFASRVSRVGLPSDAPAKSVNVDCGEYYQSMRQ